MKKRWLLWALGTVLQVVGVAIALPVSRYPLMALVLKERLVNGRPVDYWLDALKEEDPKARRQAALSLGDADICKGRPKTDPHCLVVVGALAETLGDPDGLVRKCAATSFLLYPR